MILRESLFKNDVILNAQEVHVWCANLDSISENFEFLLETLSGDERERGKRFRFWRDQQRYITCRGLLRFLIGCYLHVEPRELQFQYNEFGKPSLSFGNLEFNLAHSRDLALFAFCDTAEVGVDVECIRPIEDAPGIATRFFAPTEIEAFLKTPAENQTRTFLSYWTLKEAYLKAIGEGLSYSLNNFEVVIPEDENPLILEIPGEDGDESLWSFFSLSPNSKCVAAVAVRGRNWQLNTRKLEKPFAK